MSKPKPLNRAWAKGCVLKKWYGTEKAATDSAKHQKFIAYVYPCGHCEGWHLTSKKPKQSEAS